VERFKTLLLLIECGVDGFFFSPSVTQLSVPALLPSIAADSVVLYINEGATTNTRWYALLILDLILGGKS
jgi:hypothetical protein